MHRVKHVVVKSDQKRDLVVSISAVAATFGKEGPTIVTELSPAGESQSNEMDQNKNSGCVVSSPRLAWSTTRQTKDEDADQAPNYVLAD